MPRSDYYIPVFDSMPNHRKERSLRKAMGWNGFESVGFLVWFWLQVAADFPDGELPGLDRLEALLRDVWKAADGKPKKERIQLVASMLLTCGLVDEADETGPGLIVHDWEEGAGMFAVKRQYEREKKRRQRRRERLPAGENVPGTGAERPPDVPGEKKKEKEKETPPNPPQAGGEDFLFLSKQILDLWRHECGRVGVDCVNDNPTRRGVARFAKAVMAGEIGLPAIPLAMRGFLALKSDSGQSDPKARLWNLDTCAKSPSTFLPLGRKDGETPPSPPPEPAPMVSWIMRCDTCGAETSLCEPPAAGPPEPVKCFRRAGSHPCNGAMRVVEREAKNDG